jgi:hypothetical protein
MNYSTETINLFLLKNIETKYLIKIVLLLIELINICIDLFLIRIQFNVSIVVAI